MVAIADVHRRLPGRREYHTRRPLPHHACRHPELRLCGLRVLGGGPLPAHPGYPRRVRLPVLLRSDAR